MVYDEHRGCVHALRFRWLMPGGARRLLNCRLLLAVTLFAILPARVFASCNDPGGPRASLDKSWVRIDRKIYLGRKGKIFQTRFNSNRLTILADHGFVSNPQIGGKTCNAGLLNVDPQDPTRNLCDIHPTQSGQRLIAKTVAGAYWAAVW
jgi:hypothetical protein